MVMARSALVFLAVVALAGPPGAFAQPADETPPARLVWRESYRETAREAGALVREIRRSVELFESRLSEEKLATVRAEELAKTRAGCERLGRLIDLLLLAGEPLGYDLQLQQDDLLNRLLPVVRVYAGLPTVAQQVAASRATFGRMGKAAAGQLPRVGALFQQNKLKEAETQFYREWDELMGLSIWFDGPTRQGVFQPLEPAKNAIEERRRQTTRQEALEWIEAELASTRPTYRELLSALEQAASELAAADTASWRGESLAGPELLQQAFAEWRRADRAADRARACEWALAGITSQDRPGISALELEQREFLKAVPAALAAVIRAEGDRAAQAGGAELLYRRYVEVVAGETSDWTAPSLWAPLEEALRHFAAAEDALAARVEAYREATEDWLRWRRRTTAAQARALAENTPLGEVVAQAAQAEGYAAGILAGAGARLATARLSRPSTAALALLGKELEGAEAVVAGPLVTSPEGMLVGPYGNRLQASLTANLPRDAAAARLRADLFAESESPLTPTAARVLVRAERGIARAAGGAITEVRLEPLIVRFAEPEPGPWQAGELSSELLDSPVFAHVMVRTHLEANWLEHDCFLLRAPR